MNCIVELPYGIGMLANQHKRRPRWKLNQYFATIPRVKQEEGSSSITSLFISINRKKRYRCTACGKTFVAHKGTVHEGLRTDEETVDKTLILMNNWCPSRAIQLAFELYEGCALLQIGGKRVIPSSQGNSTETGGERNENDLSCQ